MERSSPDAGASCFLNWRPRRELAVRSRVPVAASGQQLEKVSEPSGASLLDSSSLQSVSQSFSQSTAYVCEARNRSQGRLKALCTISERKVENLQFSLLDPSPLCLSVRSCVAAGGRQALLPSRMRIKTKTLDCQHWRQHSTVKISFAAEQKNTREHSMTIKKYNSGICNSKLLKVEELQGHCHCACRHLVRVKSKPTITPSGKPGTKILLKTFIVLSPSNCKHVQSHINIKYMFSE